MQWGNTLRVYEIFGTVKYGGGLAVVAARSRVEAINTLTKDGETSWTSIHGFDSISAPKCIRGVTAKYAAPRIISEFTWIE